jgi:ATP-dependent helicase/nuclease subunit B
VKKGTLFIAPLGARNKKETVFKEIVSLCPGNNYSPVLYLCPNNFVLTTARSEFFSYLKTIHKKSAYIPFKSTTIKQLASNIHEEFVRNNTISERIRTLVICEILKEKNIGYARLLSDLYKKIRHYILDKDLSQIKKELKQLIFEEKASDRAVRAIEVLEKYDEELSKKGLTDPDEMLGNSIHLIREHVCQNTEHYVRTTDNGQRVTNKTQVDFETLVIDGFFDPSPLELEIIRSLIDKADNTYILAEEHTDIHRQFQSYKKLTAVKLKKTAYRENRGYYSYPSMEDEVTGIAKAVKKHILEGIKPWEITVCFPLLSKYLPMLKRVLKKHGIPSSVGEYNLSNTGPFVALQEMITCLVEDYPRNDFLALLTSPHFPAIPDIVKEWAVFYSYRAGIVKGKESWLSVQKILLNSPTEGEMSEDQMERLGEFQRGIKLIVDTLENIKQKKDLIYFIDAYESALNKLGFFDSLDALYGSVFSDKINNQLNQLRYFTGIYESDLHGSDSPEFYLMYMLEDLKGADESRDGIKVLPFELAAGLETRILFLGGMIEGDCPSRPDIDPILPEKVKKELGIPYLEYYLKRQKKYFQRLLNVSSHEPYFSCPSADGDKIFLPSPFLNWGEALNQLNPNIFTEEEVLVQQGLLKHSDLPSGIFWNGEMSFSKKAFGILRRRIGRMSKGFFSVTDIDFYRKCPLRFYIEKVLCFEIETPPKFEVEARLWGSLAHKTLENLFKDGDIELDIMEENLFQGLEKSLKQFPIGLFWSKVAKEIFQKLLPMLKEQETEIRMQGFRPYMVEKSLKAEINGLRFKGKIDRIDCKLKAEDKGRQTTTDGTMNTVILLDYKTGGVDNDSLQMPIYARMWQENFPEHVEKAGLYSLREGRVTWQPHKKTSMEELIQNALQSADTLVSNMKKGLFRPEPFRVGECRYCFHSPLCNKESSNRFN